MDLELSKNVLKSNTSLVGIVCKDGIVMGADRRATAGSIVMNKNAQKVVKINDYLVLSGTGMSSDIDLTQRVIAAELKLKELKTKTRPTVHESANLLGMMIYRNIRTPSMIPSMVGMLVAGVEEDGKAKLFSIEPAGGATPIDDFDANFSSGMPYILGLLERQWRPDMSVKEGVELALEALKSSTQRDVGSGNGIDVFTVTKDGIKQVISQKIVPTYS